jgi:hypothetical protein
MLWYVSLYLLLALGCSALLGRLSRQDQVYENADTNFAGFIQAIKNLSGVSDVNGCIFIAIAFRCALLGLWRQCALHSLSEYSSMVR